MSDLADTNILSELARREPDPGVLAWAHVRDHVAISVVTLEEISYGLASRSNARLRAWFDTFRAEMCEVIPITAEIALKAGEIRGRLQAAGRPRTQADMLIAATALCEDRRLVTRNVRDFEGCGIEVVNPFQRLR